MTSLVARTFADLHTNARTGSAWRFGADGTLVEDTAADVARLDYDPATLGVRGMLCEAAATSRIANGRFEGGAVGTPGTLPTGMTTGLVVGVSLAVVAFGTEGGIPTMDLRFSGTPSGTGFYLVSFRPTTGAAAVQGEIWSLLAGATLQAGSLTNITSVQFRVEDRSSGGALLNSGGATVTPAAGSIRAALTTATRTLVNASTANVGAHLAVGVTSGQAVDLTLRIAVGGLWKSPLAFSPSYPPVGAPAEHSRAADKITHPIPYGFARTAFTHVARGLFMQAAPAGVTRGIWQMDDGTDANRIRIENPAGGSALSLVVTVAGSDVATLALGSMTPGAPFGVALAAADGDMAAIRGGGTIATAAVPMPPGLAFMRVGAAGYDHAVPMNGWFRVHRLLRGRSDNATLAALAA